MAVPSARANSSFSAGCLPEDLTYAEVAVRMGKSEFAVKKYVHNLFKRFKINSKGGLIKLGLRRGLDRLGPPVGVG